MDRNLIAPCPDHHWHVSKILDPRRSNGEKELIVLSGKSLLLPQDEAFHPEREGCGMEAQKIDRMNKKSTNATIHVRGSEITVIRREDEDYISLTDMVRNFEGGSALIEQWLKNKDTVLFLGVWEQLNNPDFNSPGFEGIKNEAGRNSFYLSAKKWMDTTGARGLIAKAGRYGGKALYATAHRSKIQNHQSAFINPRPPPTAHRPPTTDLQYPISNPSYPTVIQKGAFFSEKSLP